MLVADVTGGSLFGIVFQGQSRLPRGSASHLEVKHSSGHVGVPFVWIALFLYSVYHISIEAGNRIVLRPLLFKMYHTVNPETIKRL